MCTELIIYTLLPFCDISTSKRFVCYCLSMREQKLLGVVSRGSGLVIFAASSMLDTLSFGVIDSS